MNQTIATLSKSIKGQTMNFRDKSFKGGKELLNREVLLCTRSASLPQHDDDAWSLSLFLCYIPTTRDLNLLFSFFFQAME